MQLIIKYKRGELRTINLHPDFFRSGIENETIPTKAMTLAYEYGPDPYHIAVMRGGDSMYEKFIKGNIPQPVTKEKPVDYFQIKKDLRKEFKGVKFTGSERLVF